MQKMIQMDQTCPQIIAHRGYCSLFPENTMESIEAALHKSHLVEFDILLTKDHQVVIFHDRFLSHITDVDSFPKFANRKRTASYDFQQGQKDRNDWWVNDFTLAQLKELKVKQVFPQRPQLKHINCRIPTLQEALLEVLDIKRTSLQQNKCGFLIEIKNLWEHKDDQWDSILIEKLAEILLRVGLGSRGECQSHNFPIVLQSFNHTMLKQLQKTKLSLPVVHLFDKVESITHEFLKGKEVKNQIGIGITSEHANEEIRKICDGLGWKIYYWTLRDDQSNKLPFGCSCYEQVYHYLIRVGIDGLITEFPEKCEEYIHSYHHHLKS